MIKTNSSLIDVNLSCNRLGELLWPNHLASALEINKSITTLDMGNTGVDTEGAKTIVAIACNYHLQNLDGLESLLDLKRDFEITTSELDKEMDWLSHSKNYQGDVNLLPEFIRNRKLAALLQPLYKAQEAHQLLDDLKVIENMLEKLEALIPDCTTISATYSSELYRLLIALSYRLQWQQAHHALPNLIIPFSYPALQQMADYLLVHLLYLSVGVPTMLPVEEKLSLTKACDEVLLYSCCEIMTLPDIKGYALTRLHQLIYKKELSIHEHASFAEKTLLLSGNTLSRLLKKALETIESSSQEASWLSTLLKVPEDPFALSHAYHSQAFINVLTTEYPDKRNIITIEQILYHTKLNNLPSTVKEDQDRYLNQARERIIELAKNMDESKKMLADTLVSLTPEVEVSVSGLSSQILFFNNKNATLIPIINSQNTKAP